MQKKTRLYVHIGFTILIFLVIAVFNSFNDASVVSAVFKVAGFTYGPILGLYSFGLITRKKVKDKLVPLICIIAPILSIILNYNSEKWFNGFKFGFEILIVNVILTMLGLWLITIKPKTSLN